MKVLMILMSSKHNFNSLKNSQLQKAQAQVFLAYAWKLNNRSYDGRTATQESEWVDHLSVGQSFNPQLIQSVCLIVLGQETKPYIAPNGSSICMYGEVGTLFWHPCL